MTKEQNDLFYHFLTTLEHSEELFTVMTDIRDNYAFDPEKLHMAIMEKIDDLKKQHTWIPVSDPPKNSRKLWHVIFMGNLCASTLEQVFK